MANLNSLKKYLGYRFSSGGVIGSDFKSFSTKLRNYIKAVCDENGLEMVSYNRNHYEASGFLKYTKTGQYIYWSISDVRFWQDEWYNSVLIRLADHEKDYHGKENNRCSLADIGNASISLAMRNLKFNINGKEFNDRQLRQEGSEIASLWGAECYDYEVDNEKQKVIFSCIEHGEPFITEKAFAEF